MRGFHWKPLVALGLVLGVILALVVPVGPARADVIRSDQWYLNFLNIAQALRYSEGAGVTVALLDTGVDATHPDLVDSVLPGAAVFPGATGDGRAATNEHGTRMAGLIAGHGHGPDGGLGVLGIAPKATILPVRMAEPRFSSAVIPAIDWATEHGANVISISFGWTLDDDRLRQAVENAIAHDIVVVAAVGNRPDVSSVTYPAAYPGVVAVAGVDEKGNHGDFSVTGPGVVLAAPGANIVTTGLNHGYGTSSGTSDSTAIVAGVAALIRSKYPNLSAAEVVHRLIATATDKGPPGRDNLYGYGIVDPVAALTANVPPLPASPSDASVRQSVIPQPHDASARVWLLVGLGVLGVVVIFSAVGVMRRRAGL